MGPKQSGKKNYVVQQILEHNRIVHEGQKSIRIHWYYNQWQECYEDLRKSLEKSIQFERGPELSEDLYEINPWYNNITILDDLKAEATDISAVLDYLPKADIETASAVILLLLHNMFLKGKYDTDFSRNAQYLALFRSLIRNTPAGEQILADLFGECYVYHFGVKSPVHTKPKTYCTKKVYSTTAKTTDQTTVCNSLKTSEVLRELQTVVWSNACIPEWQKFTLGVPGVRKFPKDMYNTSRKERHQLVRGGVLINGENYWPVKLKHWSTGHTKWVNLNSDEPTVQSIVKETMKNTTDKLLP